MFTELCDVLDLHAATKDNTAGRTRTGKNIITYDQTTGKGSSNMCNNKGTHDDIPNGLLEQLYAEQNKRHERHKKSSNNPASGSTCPPIQLHVLPSPVVPSYNSHWF
jgi:hypothetical protein